MFKHFSYLSILLLLAFNPIPAQETFNTLVYKGNKKFDNKQYEQASTVFADAIKKKEGDFGAHYNLGNSLYKSKKYDEAKVAYQKAQRLTQDPLEKAAAFYNMGNAQLQAGAVEQAVDAYRQALKYDGDNEAILKNLQIAKKLKQQGQSEPNKDPNSAAQQQKNRPGSDQQENPSSNAESKNLDNGSSGKNQKGKGAQGNLPEPQKNSPDNAESSKLPKELQQLIMERSAQQEKETARRLMNKKAYSVPQSNEKDW